MSTRPHKKLLLLTSECRLFFERARSLAMAVRGRAGLADRCGVWFAAEWDWFTVLGDTGPVHIHFEAEGRRWVVPGPRSDALLPDRFLTVNQDGSGRMVRGATLGELGRKLGPNVVGIVDGRLIPGAPESAVWRAEIAHQFCTAATVREATASVPLQSSPAGLYSANGQLRLKTTTSPALHIDVATGEPVCAPESGHVHPCELSFRATLWNS